MHENNPFQKLNEAMRSPEMAVSMIDHLVKIGQIPDQGWSLKTTEEKLQWAKEEWAKQDAADNQQK